MLQPYEQRVSAPIYKQSTEWVGAAEAVPSAPVPLFLPQQLLAALNLPLLQAVRHSASMWPFSLNDPLSVESVVTLLLQLCIVGPADRPSATVVASPTLGSVAYCSSW